MTLSSAAFTLLLIAAVVLGGVLCRSDVRVTELRVPPEALLGDSVRLGCRYHLGAEELYVVKWYKDELEFYRFEPKDRNQSVYFPQPGVDIDLSRSGGESVFLRKVGLDSAGAYKCQVSTDAPTYSCVQAVKRMSVVALPSEGPVISVGEGEWGDNVTLNCTSARSKPAPRLTWIVNGRPVAATADHGVTVFGDALESRSSSLRLPAGGGRLAVRCEASFPGRTAATLGRDVTLIEIDGASSCTFPSSTLLVLIVLITLWPGFR